MSSDITVIIFNKFNSGFQPFTSCLPPGKCNCSCEMLESFYSYPVFAGHMEA